MYFSKNVRFLREKNGYTLKELASKLGYKSLNTIQKWESGVNVPPQSMLYKLSELFDIPYEDLTNIDVTNPEYNWSEKLIHRDNIIEELSRLMEFMSVEELNFIHFIAKRIVKRR